MWSALSYDEHVYRLAGRALPRDRRECRADCAKPFQRNFAAAIPLALLAGARDPDRGWRGVASGAGFRSSKPHSLWADQRGKLASRHGSKHRRAGPAKRRKAVHEISFHGSRNRGRREINGESACSRSRRLVGPITSRRCPELIRTFGLHKRRITIRNQRILMKQLPDQGRDAGQKNGLGLA